jgi:aspartyl-tRNA(Asn)/glutamyl-tRNA(Gln) amidotransferase subunit B
VSVRPRGQEKYGTKAEVKNVNSFRFIRAALEYEIERQVEVIESGGRVVQETRLWNANEGRTYSMRSKEQAHDYRYFPEPDLPPLILTPHLKAEVARLMPELPEARRKRMIAEYEISEQDAQTITATRPFADYFEEGAKKVKTPRRLANVLLGEQSGRLNAKGLTFDQSPISLSGNVMAANLLDEGKINSKQLKQLFDTAFETGEDFGVVYEREKPQQITDPAAIEKMIDEIIAANPKQVEQYRGGKKTVAAFFVGQVMKLSKGQANPALLNELVTKKLDS